MERPCHLHKTQALCSSPLHLPSSPLNLTHLVQRRRRRSLLPRVPVEPSCTAGEREAARGGRRAEEREGDHSFYLSRYSCSLEIVLNVTMSPASQSSNIVALCVSPLLAMGPDPPQSRWRVAHGVGGRDRTDTGSITSSRWGKHITALQGISGQRAGGGGGGGGGGCWCGACMADTAVWCVALSRSCPEQRCGGAQRLLSLPNQVIRRFENVNTGQMWMWNNNFSDSTKHRGYVDILGAATGRPSTMSVGDFSTLPRIADGCGVCVPAASKTQWVYETGEEANCQTGAAAAETG
ncbi:unnamed protein product [Pleuronectes platessa]|uniref:Uncharacterized protein n=1 Tax=Pleuronectes platessa TaxID=8262 RepID=A0A9N7Y4S6_PLEPL|nr:unnamed protein product [Pleuronectes platessa]